MHFTRFGVDLFGGLHVQKSIISSQAPSHGANRVQLYLQKNDGLTHGVAHHNRTAGTATLKASVGYINPHTIILNAAGEAALVVGIIPPHRCNVLRLQAPKVQQRRV